MKGLIYKITNKVTEKSYIGLTCTSLEKRWKRHISCSKRVKNTHVFYDALKNFDISVWSLEILEDSIEIKDLPKREQFWIETYGTMSPNGYNSTKGGAHTVMSDEVKTKMSKYWTGRPRGSYSRERMLKLWKGRKQYQITEEHKAILKNANLGKKRSDEFKKKVSSSLKGRRLSDEHRKNISKAHSNRPKAPFSEKHKTNIGLSKRKTLRCVETNKIYDKIEMAAEDLKVSVPSIRMVLCGLRKSVKGYSFEYVKKEVTNEQS